MCSWSESSCDQQGSLKAHTRVIRYGLLTDPFFIIYIVFISLRMSLIDLFCTKEICIRSKQKVFKVTDFTTQQ